MMQYWVGLILLLSFTLLSADERYEVHLLTPEVQIYERPALEGKVQCQLKGGEHLVVVHYYNDWYQTYSCGTRGYVHAKHIQELMLPSNNWAMQHDLIKLQGIIQPKERTRLALWCSKSYLFPSPFQSFAVLIISLINPLLNSLLIIGK